jgi:hypothetical protein
LVPALDDQVTQWPWVVLGVAFAVYGAVLIAYGHARGRAVDRVIPSGGFAALGPRINFALSVAGALLAVATCVLIAAG